jgi:hypothetical protein
MRAAHLLRDRQSSWAQVPVAKAGVTHRRNTQAALFLRKDRTLRRVALNPQSAGFRAPKGWSTPKHLVRRTRKIWAIRDGVAKSISRSWVLGKPRADRSP